VPGDNGVRSNGGGEREDQKGVCVAVFAEKTMMGFKSVGDQVGASVNCEGVDVI
jgi:hypothetical protein